MRKVINSKINNVYNVKLNNVNTGHMTNIIYYKYINSILLHLVVYFRLDHQRIF